MSSFYVQYGCGWSAPDGWLNFDASPTLRFERLPLIGKLYTKNDARFPQNVSYGDIVKGLPVPAESCEAVYCSHILEHLALNEFRQALVNTHRILRPGGLFRLVLPDLEQCVTAYMNDDSADAAVKFMSGSYLGLESRPRTLLELLMAWFGNSRHLWMWDYKSMVAELESAGFSQIRRAEFGDSIDPKFGEVEEEERWAGCLGIECRK